MTKLTSGTLICGSVLIAGTIFLAGCHSQAPAAAADAPAATPEAKPRAEQALLEDLAVANRILTKELAILDIQAHVTARSRTNPNHYYIARFIAPGAAVTSDFIENDLDSKPVDGPRNDQAREIYLHGEITPEPLEARRARAGSGFEENIEGLISRHKPAPMRSSTVRFTRLERMTREDRPRIIAAMSSSPRTDASASGWDAARDV